jgi:5'-nucleotidase
MKILVTNDDGINSIGLRYLAGWCRKLGDVTVIAPKYEQSGRSHGIVIDRPFEVVRTDALSDLGIEAYSIDAAPADCIRFTVDRIGDDFDVVFSGINNGINLGHDISYSGTVGAAFEANYAGFRAVSVSTVFDNIPRAAEWLDAVWEFINARDGFAHASLFNVNIPPEPRGIRLTEQGTNFYRDHFVSQGDNKYRSEFYITRDVSGAVDLDIDIDAVLTGWCSVTPLTTKRTDYGALAALR